MVRCADCGCLSGTDPNTKELVEVDRFLREKWKTVENGKQVIQKTPVCCKRLIDFHEKLGNQPDGSVHEATVVQIIHGDIGACPGFVPYRRGESPTKILDMIDLRENQRFQDEQREKERRWQAEQSALADKRQEERDERQRQWQDRRDEREREQKRLDRRQLLWIAFLVALSGLGGVIVGAFLRRP